MRILFLHGPMTWKVMQRNAWKDIANCRMKRYSNCIKSQRHAWMTTFFKDEENGSVGDLSTAYSQIVLKRLY